MLPYFEDSKQWLEKNKTGILVVTGPTASGKTGYAIKLAQFLGNTEIINADSRQIYTDLFLLTANPTKKEQENIPHHLFDFYSPEKTMNVSEWRDLALKKINEIHSRKKRVILCGGTGLWINALTKNFSLGVEPNAEFREKMNTKSGEELHALLQQKDPEEAKKLPPTNKKYLIRALEICETKGNKTSVSVETPPLYPSFIIATTHPRQTLYNRINQRRDEMFTQGVLEEGEKFIKKYPDAPKNDSAFISHGIPEMITYFSGEKTPEDLEYLQEKMAQNTRHYAKRQLTWWRRDMRIHWVDMSEKSVMNIQDKKY